MLVCWEWLAEYVQLDVQPDEMALMFAMSGLNHESTTVVGSDVVIDLEVTSNRGDCLGHIGVAREAAVLCQQPLKTPLPKPSESKELATDSVRIENTFHQGCPEYTAKIIRGVKVGASPTWLVRRLASIGINSVNNVVDVTNYVMMECGQPLHAFDLKQVRGAKIVVRPAGEREKFVAIDHKTYELDSQMVVIADAERALALGGVMGGADSEVSLATTDLLIEAARFEPLAIRRAARKLKLHSPSSYRFERSPDASGLEWASLRCCELILQVAGGQLCQGIVRAGNVPDGRQAIAFRRKQIQRVLGIEVPWERVVSILTALGCQVEGPAEGCTADLSVLPPSWRGDLLREVDLIEEVARIYGYDKIPEDVAVPIGVATPRPKDIVLARARHVLSALGVDEAMTPSVVAESLESHGSPWSEQAPLTVETPLLVGSKLLRRSIAPSLLAARYVNQTQSMRNAQLYEVANVYLSGSKTSDLPSEQCTLGIVTAGDLQFAKGIVEELIVHIAGPHAQVQWQATRHAAFQPGTGLRVANADRLLGFVGLVSKSVQEAFSLDSPVAAVEMSVDALTEMLQPVRTADSISPFPAVARDLNFVVGEKLEWAQLETLCKLQGGEILQKVEYQETYRDPKKDGPGKKRILLTLHFQSFDRTLTGAEVDTVVQRIIETCKHQLEATLLG